MPTKFSIALLLIAVVSGCSFKQKKADVVIHNALIYSVDERFSKHQAMAIAGDSILELGPEREILNKYSANQTIDLGGKVVYPGFIDAHSHLLGYGLSLLNLDVRNVASEADMVAMVKQQVAEGVSVIRGRGWDQSTWENNTWPSRKNLDDITADTPLLLQRIDGHAALVNKAALDLAGITADTEIAGGIIDYENGILKENAVDFVVEKLPKATLERQTTALKKAAKNCFSAGLTTVCDAGLTPTQRDAYLTWYQNEGLPIRVYAMADPNPKNFTWYQQNGPIYSDFFHLHSVKAYMDGSLGSRSAALLAPYADDTENKGVQTIPTDSLKVLAQKCFDLNLQLNTHCIGDRALRNTLNTYKSILAEGNDKRWRIEHVQVFDPADLETFRSHAVIPSVQPTHATSDAKWIVDRLGTERQDYAYAYQSLRQQLGWIPLGTDFPVEDIDPIKTFSSAVFRRPLDNKEQAPILPNEALTKEEALRGMTIWAALSMKMEDQVGSLEAGKKADFVVLNYDLLDCDYSMLRKVKVLKTFVGGEEKFSAL